MRLSKDKIEKLKCDLQGNQGIMKTQELYQAGINYRNIHTLIERKVLVRVKNGYYKWEQQDLPELQQIHALFPDGVLTLQTALYYYGYTTEQPFCWDLAVDKNTSKSRFKLEYPVVTPYYTQEDCLELGRTTILLEGLTFYIYEKERLICDCLKYESKISHDLLMGAIRSYLLDPEKNIEKLSYYARKRKVSTKVEQMIGVWLS